MNHLVTFSGFQNGIQTDTTKWFTLVMRKSVGSTYICIPRGGGGPYPYPLKFNLVTTQSHFNV